MKKRLSPLDRIAHLHPCPTARVWLRKFASAQRAWECCSSASWMEWYLCRVLFNEYPRPASARSLKIARQIAREFFRRISRGKRNSAANQALKMMNLDLLGLLSEAELVARIRYLRRQRYQSEFLDYILQTYTHNPLWIVGHSYLSDDISCNLVRRVLPKVPLLRRTK